MSVFITLLVNDIKLFFRDWKAVLLLIIMPFLFICLFVYALSPYLNKSSFIEPFSIALVDYENTAQSRILANQLDAIGLFREVIRTDEKEAVELIKQDKIAAAVILPADFTNGVSMGENKPITVIGNRARPLQSFVVKNLMQSAANLISAGQSAIYTIYHYDEKAGLAGSELDKDFNDSAVKVLLATLARREIFSETESSIGLDVTPMEYFTSALLVIFLMFAGMPAAKMLVNERNLGITGRLGVSPVRTWQIILSKFLISILLSSIQFITIVALTSAAFKNYWGAPIKSILALFGGIIFAVSAWSIFVSAISKTSAAADAIGNLGILLMAVVGGSIYPLGSMPEPVRNISKLTINRWAMDGFLVLFSGNEALSPANSVYALLLIGAAFLLIAVVILGLVRRRGEV